MDRYAFFKVGISELRKLENAELPGRYSSQMWEPGLTRIYPSELSEFYNARVMVNWWILHYIFRFSHKIFIIYHRGEVIHYTLWRGRYLNCPFMSKNDLQVRYIWTKACHRGEGLTRLAIKKLAESTVTKGEADVWWYCERGNEVSQIVASKLGFARAGEGYATEFKFAGYSSRRYVVTDWGKG